MSDALHARSRPAAGPLDRLASAVIVLATDIYAAFARPIGVVVFVLYVATIASTVVLRPDANWDMLAYLAVAEEGNFADPAALHTHVYGEVKAGVTEGEYAALTTNDPYRVRMAEDPAAFHSMLPMYRVKFLYTEILSTLSNFMQPVAAVRAVSVFATLLFGAVVLLWLRSTNALALAPVVAGIMIVSGFADAARAGAPDMLTSAFMLAGLYAHMRRQEALTAVLLFLAFLVRPDNVAFLGVFAVLLLVFRQWSWGALAGFAASFAAYFPISHWAGHPGWWTHFYFTTIDQQLTLDGFHPAFSVLLYVKALISGLVRALTFETWLGVGVLALAGWFVTERAGYRLEPRAALLFAALVLGAMAKFVLFPIPETRIYLPHLLPAFLLLATPLMAVIGSVRRGRTATVAGRVA